VHPRCAAAQIVSDHDYRRVLVRNIEEDNNYSAYWEHEMVDLVWLMCTEAIGTAEFEWSKLS
jgi:hypothetical protein